MEDYEMITRLGGGTFADVYKALEKSTGDIVAIKVLKKKYNKFEDCLELRECKSLKKLNDDNVPFQDGKENIIKLKQIIYCKKTGTLNLVFEFMERDLFELMKSREPRHLSESEIKSIVFQTLQGLCYMHKYGFFHRDMKPENLLLVGTNVKIADFGLAREIRSVPPYTEYVSTRYYRAPECILKSTNYNSPVDIWALGCIMAEMYIHPQPLFYGANEKEVLYKMCTILGTPTHNTWAKGVNQAKSIGLKLPNSEGVSLSKVIPKASEDAIDLIQSMLRWSPTQRETAHDLLQHRFFFGFSNVFSGRFSSFVEPQNKKERYEKEEDENQFSKMLNDTATFDKLLNKLKKEEKEEMRIFLKKEREKDNFNENKEIFRDLLSENKLNKNENNFTNKFYDNSNPNNKNINNSNLFDFNHKQKDDFFEKNQEKCKYSPQKNKILNYYDNNLRGNVNYNKNEKNDVDLDLFNNNDINNYNKVRDSGNSNLIYNNDKFDFAFENTHNLKLNLIGNNNSRRSAKKLKKESEFKYLNNFNNNCNDKSSFFYENDNFSDLLRNSYDKEIPKKNIFENESFGLRIKNNFESFKNNNKFNFKDNCNFNTKDSSGETGAGSPLGSGRASGSGSGSGSGDDSTNKRQYSFKHNDSIFGIGSRRNRK